MDGRYRLLESLARAARRDSDYLDGIGLGAIATFARTEAAPAPLPGLGERGLGQQPGPAFTEPLDGLGGREVRPPAAGTSRSPSPPAVVAHMGGPRDGQRCALPPRCPCCNAPVETGSVLSYQDGSRYIVDLGAGRAMFVPPAFLEAHAA